MYRKLILFLFQIETSERKLLNKLEKLTLETYTQDGTFEHILYSLSRYTAYPRTLRILDEDLISILVHKFLEKDLNYIEPWKS